MTAQLRSYKREQQAANAATILASFLSIDDALTITDNRYLLDLLFIALGPRAYNTTLDSKVRKCASVTGCVFVLSYHGRDAVMTATLPLTRP
jgi:hypothetical protein